MADAVDAHEAAQAPPTSKASGHPSMPAMSIDDTPTEPATSPRVMEVPVQRWAPELQLPTLEQGPREEPERFATRYILNDGTMTQEAHDALLRKAAQAFNNQDMERELDNAMAREHQPVVKKAPPSMGRPLPAGFYMNLQGLVHLCSLHRQRHQGQMQLKG